MQIDQGEMRRHLAATAARASAPGFSADDVAARIRRIRRGRTRIGTAVSAAAIAAAAVAVPLALGTAGNRAGESIAGAVPGPGVSPEKTSPPLPWTVTVNGQAVGVPESLADAYTGETQFDVVPGEKLTVKMTITVPAHTEMTKFFLGITGDSAGIGPHGPIGMRPVLATASHLAAGPHEFTVHWTVPRAAPPTLGYQLAMATFWPRGTENEPAAEEIPMVDFGVKSGTAVPAAAVAGLRDQVLLSAKRHGDAKPTWAVAVRTTLAKAMAAVQPGGKTSSASPSTPVYLCVANGDFRAGNHYVWVVIDAASLSSHATGLSSQGPAFPLATLGPLASLAGGQPAHD